MMVRKGNNTVMIIAKLMVLYFVRALIEGTEAGIPLSLSGALSDSPVLVFW